MKTRCSFALVLALVFSAACAPKVNDPADVQAVTQVVNDFVKAVNNGDAPGAAAVMADDAVYLDAYIPAIKGKPAIEAFFRSVFEQWSIQETAEVADVRVSGDLAVVRGTYTQTVTPKAEGLAAEVDSGNWTGVMQRRPGGGWACVSTQAISDRPAPGQTADGADEQAIIALEREWVAALSKPDLTFLDRTLAPEYMDSADGQAVSKAQLLGALKGGAITFESVTLRDLEVHVFGYVAIATCRVDVKGSFGGQPIPPSQYSTDVFVKRDGRWQAVSTQNLTIK